MFCTACGTGNAEVSNYCKQCGHKIDRVVSPRISEEDFDRSLPPEEQASALLERAYRLRKSGDLAAAVRLCEEALLLNPDSTSVHSLLGQLQEQRGEHEAAIREYERVLQLNPGSIADRVKLDELRGEGLPTPIRRRVPPHISMPDHTARGPNGRQMLAVAGTAGLLMIFGGALALQFRGHGEKNAASDSLAPGIGRVASRSDGISMPSSNGVSGSSASLPSQAPINSGAAGVSAGPGLPTNATISPYVSYPPPVVYVQQPPRTVYVQPSGESNTQRANTTLPNLDVRPHNRLAQGNGGDRIHLDEGAGGHISINVHPEGTEPDPAPPGSVPAKLGPGKSGVKPPVAVNGGTGTRPPVINIHQNIEAGGTGGIAPPGEQSQSLISFASLKFKDHQYDEAIKAYRRSLSGAGSQTAYVYQQMAICFQKNNDRNSARDHFNSAIGEYNKLVQANQQVDLAKAGIRVCENGIKLCNAE